MSCSLNLLAQWTSPTDDAYPLQHGTDGIVNIHLLTPNMTNTFPGLLDFTRLPTERISHADKTNVTQTCSDINTSQAKLHIFRRLNGKPLLQHNIAPDKEHATVTERDNQLANTLKKTLGLRKCQV